MNKKVVCVICAVLAFAGCSIWVSEVPIVSTLTTFLCTAAGFVCGYFYNKAKSEKLIASFEAEALAANSRAISVEEKLYNLQNSKPAKTSKKSTKE